jgi:hypothetical protein
VNTRYNALTFNVGATTVPMGKDRFKTKKKIFEIEKAAV